MTDPTTPNEPDATRRQEQVTREREHGPEPSATAATPESLLADEPSPQVEPIYLRGRGRHPRPRRERSVLRPPGWDETGEETLVNAISRRVLEGLALSLPETVHAAVLALAPRMAVSPTLATEEDSPTEKDPPVEESGN